MVGIMENQDWTRGLDSCPRVHESTDPVHESMEHVFISQLSTKSQLVSIKHFFT